MGEKNQIDREILIWKIENLRYSHKSETQTLENSGIPNKLKQKTSGP